MEPYTDYKFVAQFRVQTDHEGSFEGLDLINDLDHFQGIEVSQDSENIISGKFLCKDDLHDEAEYIEHCKEEVISALKEHLKYSGNHFNFHKVENIKPNFYSN